jgi:hypothetical protein
LPTARARGSSRTTIQSRPLLPSGGKAMKAMPAPPVWVLESALADSLHVATSKKWTDRHCPSASGRPLGDKAVAETPSSSGNCLTTFPPRSQRRHTEPISLAYPVRNVLTDTAILPFGRARWTGLDSDPPDAGLLSRFLDPRCESYGPSLPK